MKNPILVITVIYILGISLGMHYSAIIHSYFLEMLGSFTTILVIVLTIFYMQVYVFKLIELYTWLILITFLILGIQAGLKTKINPIPTIAYQSNCINLEILSESITKPGYQEYLAKITAFEHNGLVYPADFKVKIYLNGHGFKLEYGITYLVSSQIKDLEGPLNPAEFDYKKYLNKKDIWAKTYLNKSQIISSGDFNGNLLIQMAQKIRKQRIDYLNSSFENLQDAAFLATLILGYRVDLDKETTNLYTNTGTIHALSVSGMHVGLIYLIINWLLKKILQQMPNLIKYTFKYLLIICLVWMYAIICGLSAPTVRACMMISFFLLSKALNKRHSQLNLLAISALIQLTWNPFTLNELGFQLSYLAVLGIILYQQQLSFLLKFRVKMFQSLWNNIALSLSTQITTFPLCVFYFKQFPLLFLLGNLIIVIPITLIMYIGLMALIFELKFLNPIISQIIGLNHFFLKQITQFENALITQLNPSFLACIMLYTFTFCLIKYLKSSGSLPFILCSLHVLYFVISSFQINAQIKNQRLLIVYALGLKNCIAFITQSKAYLITDIEVNKSAIFQYKVKPSLDSLNVKKMTIIGWNQNYRNEDLIKTDGLVSILDKKLLILNSVWDEKINSSEFDYIVFSNESKNQFSKLSYLNANKGNAKTIWILQKYPTLNRLKINTKYHVLEKNKAYLKSLN